ncbi:LIN1-like protein [Podospora australis]|uniref:LIN1-like protein n=1 Tax=Podospora australis TaxID=1536484 RepID=A0AAN6WZR7_9PEZI|nr:LIN1-like protein [Podospora australis]
MASRFSAARPKRAGEAYARAHHGEEKGENGGPANKKVRFDVRNPSALAPSARDNDDDDDEEGADVLAADVIGAGGRATKRGAVNIDGYDSDSENETFNARAEAREKKGKEAEDVDLADALDNYNARARPGEDNNGNDDDEEVDMFGDSDAEDKKGKDAAKKPGKKNKEVNFLEDNQIEGQEGESKSGGRIQLGDTNGSDDDDDDDDDDAEHVAAAIAEEGVDEEVGAGGLKKHAPKIDAFNMRQEQEEGAFDESGNYIRKAADADAVHDRWLEGVSKKDMKKAAAAHEKREAELRKQQRENDSISTGDLFRSLILKLERGETALEALARLRKGQTKPKKVPKWKQKKMKGNGSDAMDVDQEKEPEDPKQVKIKEAINAIADAADKLMQRDFPEIYDYERERLVRMYYNETGERWEEPSAQPDENGAEGSGGTGVVQSWEFRWVDGRDDGKTQGPFDGPTMEAWREAGYFGEGVEFRHAGEEESGWTRVATFV